MAIKRGKVAYVIVCGHSDCKAINTLYNLHQSPDTFDITSPMDHWLRRHGHQSIQKLDQLLKDNKAGNYSKPLIFESENKLVWLVYLKFFKLGL